MVAAPACYGYRRRVQFKVAVSQGKLKIGFFRNGSHVVEDAAQGCPIAVPVINEALKCFRTVLPAFSELQAISQISIDAGELGLIAVVHYSGQNIRKISSFLTDRSSDLKSCTGLFIQSGQQEMPEHLWGDGDISYRMPVRDSDTSPCLLSYRPGGIAQVNQSQNIALLSWIRRCGGFVGTENIIDLYCGNGNFSIPLASDVASVV